MKLFIDFIQDLSGLPGGAKIDFSDPDFGLGGTTPLRAHIIRILLPAVSDRGRQKVLSRDFGNVRSHCNRHPGGTDSQRQSRVRMRKKTLVSGPLPVGRPGSCLRASIKELLAGINPFFSFQPLVSSSQLFAMDSFLRFFFVSPWSPSNSISRQSMATTSMDSSEVPKSGDEYRNSDVTYDLSARSAPEWLEILINLASERFAIVRNTTVLRDLDPLRASRQARHLEKEKNLKDLTGVVLEKVSFTRYLCNSVRRY